MTTPLAIAEEPLASGYAETREWGTSILRAMGGGESRTSLTSSTVPRRRVQMRIAPVGLENVSDLLARIVGAGAAYYAAPLWFSRLELTGAPSGAVVPTDATAATEFDRADLAVLISADGTTHEVGVIASTGANSVTLENSVSGSFVAGDVIVPALQAAIAEDTPAEWRHERSAAAVLDFLEVEGLVVSPSLPSSGFSTYATFPIFAVTLHDRLRQTTATEDAIFQGEAWQRGRRISLGVPEQRLSVTLVQYNQTDRRTLADFFDEMRGALGKFWLEAPTPTWRLAQAASLGASAVVVTGSTDDELLDTVTRHVSIPGGGLFRITSANVDTPSAGLTTLNLNGTLAADLEAAAEVRSLYLVRFGSDVLRIEASEGIPDVSTAAVRLVEIQKETPTS